MVHAINKGGQCVMQACEARLQVGYIYRSAQRCLFLELVMSCLHRLTTNVSCGFIFSCNNPAVVQKVVVCTYLRPTQLGWVSKQGS